MFIENLIKFFKGVPLEAIHYTEVTEETELDNSICFYSEYFLKREIPLSNEYKDDVCYSVDLIRSMAKSDMFLYCFFDRKLHIIFSQNNILAARWRGQKTIVCYFPSSIDTDFIPKEIK